MQGGRGTLLSFGRCCNTLGRNRGNQDLTLCNRVAQELRANRSFGHAATMGSCLFRMCFCVDLAPDRVMFVIDKSDSRVSPSYRNTDCLPFSHSLLLEVTVLYCCHCFHAGLACACSASRRSDEYRRFHSSSSSRRRRIVRRCNGGGFRCGW